MSAAGKKRTMRGFFAGAGVLVAYSFAASAPLPKETTLEPAWIRPLASAEESADAERPLIPYRIASSASAVESFGYFDAEGRFALNRKARSGLSISRDAWSEYEATPTGFVVKDPFGADLASVAARGYPFFDDGRTFVVAPEQNSVAEYDADGKLVFERALPAPATCADAAGGMLLVGLLDGRVQLIDADGKAAFDFSPGGSRLETILAAALSSDGNKMALIAGIDPQRFLLLEKTNGNFKVTHHEFLGKGFRRPAAAGFAGNDRWILFEREGGLGVYDTKNKASNVVETEGRVAAFESDARDDLLFLVAEEGPNRKALLGIELPDRVFLKSRFDSPAAFIDRRGDRVFVGGDGSIVAFDLRSR